jgi:hypothetical protein
MHCNLFLFVAKYAYYIIEILSGIFHNALSISGYLATCGGAGPITVAARSKP